MNKTILLSQGLAETEYSYTINMTRTCHIIVCCCKHDDVLIPMSSSNVDCLLDLLFPFKEIACFCETSTKFGKTLSPAISSVDVQVQTALNSVCSHQIFLGSFRGYITQTW